MALAINLLPWMIKNTLKDSLKLKLDLTHNVSSDHQAQVHLISLPREILAAPTHFELTFSKINGVKIG